MFLYKICADTTLKADTDESFRSVANSFSAAADACFSRSKNKEFIFLSRHCGDYLRFGAICSNGVLTEDKVSAFIAEAGFSDQISNAEIEEVTQRELIHLLRTADNHNFIEDDSEILETFHLCRNYHFPERIYLPVPSLEQLRKDAKESLCDRTLVPEAERIFIGSKCSHAAGHPVHYMILADSADREDEIFTLLMATLIAGRRLKSSRATIVDSHHDLDDIARIYRTSEESTVMIRCRADENDGDRYCRRSVEEIVSICALARKYRNRTLTVFALPRNQKPLHNELVTGMGDVPLVELRENDISVEEARKYLKGKATQAGVRPDKELYRKLDSTLFPISSVILNRDFEEWYSAKLRRSVYPQYSKITSSGTLAPAALKGDSFGELNSMIGLSEAKQVITKAVDYYKAQRLFASRGMSLRSPAMHMVFTGNPGTAKTTVARLFAKIMKDHGLLAVGELHEVGRADLVGKYVGWTAKIVKNAFERAMGSVLFIDEAYSLLDDKEGMYGDEAINTIVQEMENHRDDVVVIFAGYPDKMESFLRRNPGLRSRIAFHVPFSDYSAEELCSIADFIADKNGLTYGGEVREKMRSIFEQAVKTEDFGNGRFARNLIERARMEQAGRLVRMDSGSVTDRDIATLLPEDITDLPLSGTEKQPRLGF